MAVSKKVLAVVLSCCLLGLQVVPAFASAFQKDTVNVAYLGISFGDIPDDIQKNIDTRVSVLIEQEASFYNIPADEIKNTLDASLFNSIRENLQQEDLRKAARQLNADHIFVGKIQNQSNTKETTVLVGDVIRYDREADNVYTLRIKSFFEDFNEELVRINNQLVRSIVPEEKESFFRRYLPGFLIVAATAVAITVLLSSTEGQSSGDTGGPTPPFTNH